jgi:hypothetical protein
MVSRGAVVVVPALVLLLVGCAPGAATAPTPTPAFASEAEAFAAAEEVYRAYLEASAARAEGSNNLDPQSYLSGSALSGDIEAQRALAEANLKILGATRIDTFSGIDADIGNAVASVTADACIDFSESRVVNSDGADVTPAERASTSSIRVEFAGSSAELLITRTAARGDSQC